MVILSSLFLSLASSASRATLFTLYIVSFLLYISTSGVSATEFTSSTSLPKLENFIPFNIESFGAIANIDTHAQALQNGAAFNLALQAALNSTNSTTRAVLVPAKIYSYLPTVSSWNNVQDITIFIEGTLNVSTANFSSSFPGWPNPYPVLSFSTCSNLNIISTTQKGLINGRGNLWWWYTIFIGDHRNNLLYVDSCTNMVLAGITFLNAPQYHVNLRDMFGVQVYNVTVLVDIEDQLNIYRYLGGDNTTITTNSMISTNTDKELSLSSSSINPADVTALLWKVAYASELHSVSSTDYNLLLSDTVASSFFHNMIPLTADEIFHNRAYLLAHSQHPTIQQVRQESWFQNLQKELLSSSASVYYGVVPPVPMIWALNTDGIDISGRNIVVTNCSVTNFDDSVCAKPISSGGSSYGTNCTSNFTITNIDITWGVGVSMGSVPPDVGGNCISNLTASNVTFNNPLKAIYVKPNPEKFGQPATGLISNILYENINIIQPVWWSIWVGTQQQQQPGSSGTGCSFLYPLFNSSCPTDPQVTVQNITLRNIQIYNPVLSTGVLLMNSSNPGTNFIWDNVYVHNISSFPEANGAYICENVQGIATGNTYPIPPCFTTG